jgi:hypothetical protein
MGELNCSQPELCGSHGQRDQFFLTLHDSIDFVEIDFLQIFAYTPFLLSVSSLERKSINPGTNH